MKRILSYILIAMSYTGCITIDDLKPASLEELKEELNGKNDGNMNGSIFAVDAIDLNSSGETANCYIVSSAGIYKFKPVKGNSSESVGNVSSVAVLWETFGTDIKPSIGDLIKAVNYDDGYVVFSTPVTFREGNAVIAAKNSSGEILWSWHIWLTDQPEEQVYTNKAGTMMDRNLGSTSAIPGDVTTIGLLYQWGRKDPFLNMSSFNEDEVEMKSTGYWPSSVKSSASSGTIEYAVQNPMTFIDSNGNNLDWHYTGTSYIDVTRWQDNVKTIYDPCPTGWRVPTKDIWSKAYFDSGYYKFDNVDMGILFGSKCSVPSSWYPLSAYRTSDGICYSHFLDSYYWTASTSSRDDVYVMAIRNYNGDVDTYLHECPSHAYSIRCMRDTLSVMPNRNNQFILKHVIYHYYYPSSNTLKLLLATDGVNDRADGFGHFLQLELYSPDGYLHEGIYTASATSDIVSEGEFRAGSSEDSWIGTWWYDVNKISDIANYNITDGKVYINIEENNVMIRLESSSLNTSFVQECSKFERNSGIPINVYTNGSVAKSATANCYIASSDGTYTFDAVKGNSNEQLLVSSVEVLWESFGTDVTPAKGELIQSVSYSNGKITYIVPSPFKEGNAVIAAKNSSGNIIWSWHIWLTDYPQEIVLPNSAGIMMDRNLGATSTTPGDIEAFGLLYQWGRKDPFLGSSSSSEAIEAKSTGIWTTIKSSTSCGNIDYSICYPMTFIDGSDSYNNDWIYGDSGNDALWKRFKTIYDPCPSGWCLPDGAENGVWAKADINNSYSYIEEDKGCLCDFDCSVINAWFPLTSYRASNGTLCSTVYCYIWDLYRGTEISSYGWGSGFMRRSYGASIRCIYEGF